MATLQQIETLRRFNRFYTQRIGVLGERHLNTRYSLTQIRVLHEIGTRQRTHASEIATLLGLDAGYLSRILSNFVRLGFVTRTPRSTDKRQHELTLTPAGRAEFDTLEALAREQMNQMLEQMSGTQRQQCTRMFAQLTTLLSGTTQDYPIILRAPRPGDMGWIIHRHGVMIASEFGWDSKFESLVARITADFIDHHDPARERCFIAEGDGEILGSIFLVRENDTVAKLRLLYVEPHTRGRGLGKRLVHKAIRAARDLDYETLRLWTTNGLDTARHIYEQAGFRLIEERPNDQFASSQTGIGTLGQSWELTL